MILLYGYLFYYFAALVGISIGYHRYFTHRSFKTSVFLEYVMLFFGTICGGRSALTWAAVHRMHHAKSDTEDDPHSPVYVGIWRVITSRWHVEYIPKKYIVDLLKNPRVVFFHRYRKHIHFAYAAAMLIAGVNYFIIFVAMPFVLAWAGFGLLNWISHKDGKPANVPIMNIIAPGEGWHKYHHDHPMAHKLNKFDIAGWTIERFFIKSKPSH
jgi:stearoyl-CoA desaturase (delta-9 desaturase)